MIVDWIFKLAAHFASPGGTRGRLPILFFHRVLQEPDALLPGGLDSRNFDIQMRALAAAFSVLPMDEAVDQLAQGRLVPRAACITFDDGYRDNFDVAAPVLRRHGLSSTFYIASDFLDGGLMFNDRILEAVRRLPSGTIDLSWLGLDSPVIGDVGSRIAVHHAVVGAIKYLPTEEREAACVRIASLAQSPLPTDVMMSSGQVRELQRSGMCIGGHTLDHPILARISDEEARRQIEGNRQRLDSVLDRPVRHFAYPNGKPDRDYGLRHVQLVREAGYASAVTTATGAASMGSDPYQLPRLSLWHTSPHRNRLSLVRAGLSRTEPQRAMANGAEAQPGDRPSASL